MSIIKELEEILMVPGVTGYEEPIREYLSQKSQSLGFHTKWTLWVT